MNWDNFSQGIYIFVLGLAKKVLLADTFGNAVNIGFSNIAELDSINAVLTMTAYTIQIYFDFSGYCDMAIGIGRMFNINLPVNFNSPYKALTITEFWERWHKTLTHFFTKYVYIPLGGNRKGRIHTYINVMFVFLLSGLWHGANWTFILWGACHGIFSVITRFCKSVFDKMHPVFSWMLTFSFINVTWILFRADSVHDALRLINQILSFDIRGGREDFVNCFNLPELCFLLKKGIGRILFTAYPRMNMILFFSCAFFLIMGSSNAYEKMLCFRPTIVRMLLIMCLLVWCILSFSGVSTFLYFNF